MKNHYKKWLFESVQSLAWEWKILVGVLVVVLMVGTSVEPVRMAQADTGGPADTVVLIENTNPKTIEAMRWPLNKIDVSQKFGGFHSGIDLRAVTGTAVWAARPGKVIQAEKSWGGYGNLVVIQHDDEVQTWYGHLSKILVKKEDLVDSAVKIGEVGSTGRSTGPHLHFEVRKGGKFLNPAAFLGIL